MRKKILLLSVLAFTGTVFAQASSTQLTEREKIIFEIEQKVEPGAVFEFLKKCDKEIQVGMKNKKPLSAIKYFSFATSAKIYLDYRWFIADTELCKTWFEKIHELLSYMYKTKSYMQSAESNGQTKTEKYKKAVKYFYIAYERFGKLIKKPVRAPDNIIQKAKVEKDMWQRRMRKKYNIKEKAWYE